MLDERKQQDTIQKDTQAVAPAEAPAARKSTPGLLGTKILAWIGADWILNSTVGVTFAVINKRTKIGRDYIGKPVHNFFSGIAGKFSQNPHTVEKSASWGSDFVSIMVGGFSIIPVVNYLMKAENRVSFARWVDEKIYGKEKVANDPSFAATYDEVYHEPKQSFGIGMAARFLAIAPLITASSYPKINDRLDEHLYKPISRKTKWLAEKLHIKPSGYMLQEHDVVKLDKATGTDHVQKQSNWDFLHEKIGFDFGLTAFYMVLHERACHYLGCMFSKPQEKKPQESPATAQETHPSATLAASTPHTDEHRQHQHTKHTHKRTAVAPRSENFTDATRASQSQLSSQMALV